MADDNCRFPVLVTMATVEQQGIEDSEQQVPVEHQECTDCLTSSEYLPTFLCQGCKKHLCNICGSYGLGDHKCGYCVFSFCLDCRGDHNDQRMAHQCSDMAGVDPSVPVEEEFARTGRN